MFRLYWIQTLKLQFFPVTDHSYYDKDIQVQNKSRIVGILCYDFVHTARTKTGTFTPRASSTMRLLI